MNNQRGFTTVELATVIFAIFLTFGYIVNIWTLVTSTIGVTFSELSAFTLLQTVGVFVPPLGVITGYVSLFV